ncbi:endonuclease/exonuclease/phosphatase family protein [Roseicyclus mahoneyensis]|uniref:Endonuclease/exonuclease/phosphatase family metal-dependent hydrolase n=1 Tax=Roseicyclus mahoneyensis TaxID=164332 RepID=A0A316GGX7_9RHOB|nr:endonuclease/exonuclease/phosphatase family protein [Roseicyclus mahoneyensis]PWK60237.1 endonuclease/exonuclease/phosphatase family metal-dependent hydrolase [Roseicyclus mahoneyensis]
MADTLRIATFHTQLSRAGPGLLLRDILRGEDAQVAATVAVIAAAAADVVVLQDMDFDAGGAALTALADALAQAGIDYPHRLALRPNTGMPTGVDIDGDGRSWRARDAQGYGRFNGQGGMALLSRHPFGAVRDFSGFLWVDLPDSAAPAVLPPEALPVLRLATVAAWDVAVEVPGGPLHLLALHAGTPVFDGPEDRNGWRNADELRFWALYLEGWTPEGVPFAAEHFAVIGTFNVDPEGGEGRPEGLLALLEHPRLQDVVPRRPGGGTQTADWPEPEPGDLRVDYILPAAGMTVTGAGVLWPEGEEGPVAASVAALASDHRLVWVDLEMVGD